jgi:CubicO group peptidase (beta-lactamase class C family)
MTLLQFAQKPLLFEPGTSWFYGASTDWVGILVMRLNDMSLEAYMQKYIWDPLGIENITFHQELKPDVKRNLVTLTMRGEQGIYVMAKKTDEKVRWIYDKLYDDPVKEEFGSGGAIASAVEFIKIMDSIARDDGKLLTSESIDEMFTSQLEGPDQEKFDLVNKFLARGGGFTSRPPGTVLKHGLAGMLVMSETDTGVKAGTLSWSGIANLLWTIDRASGLSLFYASNIMPYGDFKSHEFQQLFEKEMYKRYAESQAS